MTTIDDLDKTSFTDLPPDEAIELLRQIRLSRRMPKAKTTQAVARKKKEKAMPKIDASQAAELLKILGG